MAEPLRSLRTGYGGELSDPMVIIHKDDTIELGQGTVIEWADDEFTISRPDSPSHGSIKGSRSSQIVDRGDVIRAAFQWPILQRLNEVPRGTRVPIFDNDTEAES